LILGDSPNGRGRKTQSSIGIVEKLEDFWLSLGYLLAQGCGKSSFGSVDAQSFAFGREPYI